MRESIWGTELTAVGSVCGIEGGGVPGTVSLSFRYGYADTAEFN